MSSMVLERPPEIMPEAPPPMMLPPEERRRLAEHVKNLVTEDDEPVDNFYSAKQQRLLVEPLYSSWTPPPDKEAEAQTSGPRPFLADANVAIFYSTNEPSIVPDMFLSLDVQASAEWRAQEQRSYFVWEFGKPPEVVVEIVSNRIGQELDEKRRRYGWMGVQYYVVFDPFRELGTRPLHVFERSSAHRFRTRRDQQLPGLGLSLTLWEGTFENWPEHWLRWCDREGNLIPTGAERAQREAERAQQEAERAQREAERAQTAEERAARLSAKLRELGLDPEQL